MAVTTAISTTRQDVIGSKRMVPVIITFDSSYVTGGEPITAALCGLTVLERIIFPGAMRLTAGGASGFLCSFDRTNNKIFVYKANGTTNLLEVANAVDLSGYSVDALAIGY